MKTLVILQPSFLPWCGYFDLIAKSDIFIFYDHVQFDKNGWRNRNKILNKESMKEEWITLPIKKVSNQSIKDVKLSDFSYNVKKIQKIIVQNYSKHPNFDSFFKILKNLLSKDWIFLSELNIYLTNHICKYLNIKVNSIKSSDLKNIYGKNENIINLCKQFSCERYLSGPSAKNYIDEEIFKRENIFIKWHEYVPGFYNQHGVTSKQDFYSYLSIIDFIFNMEKKNA